MVLLNSLRSRPLWTLWSRLPLPHISVARQSLLFNLCALTLVLSLLLGGGTRGGFLSDAILQLSAIPAFLITLSALIARPRAEIKGGVKWALTLCLAIVLLPLIQLIPLPPWIWTRLPQRDEVVVVFNLVEVKLPWLPISVAPTATWVSALSLLPPVAIFLAVIQLSYRERRLLGLIFLGVGVVAAMLGLIQLAQGPSSPLRFFAFTSDLEPVGFFANRNHMAALLYSLLLFGAAWATQVAFTVGSWSDLRNLEASSIVTRTGAFLLLVVFIAVEIMTRSRAGLGLMIVAVVGAVALPLADRRRPSGLTALKLLLGSAILVVGIAVQYSLYRILETYAVDPLEDARIRFARNTLAAAKAYLPFGSGVGTFVHVYPTFEPPQDTIANVYANHAHNDFAEMWLEGGVLGAALVIAFVIWFALRSAKIWWNPPGNARVIDLLLARAATMVIPLIMAHSVVDYPLRTGAMMAVFALSCALLIEPLTGGQGEPEIETVMVRGKHEEDSLRVTAPRVPRAPEEPDRKVEKSSPKPLGKWGEDIEWPEKWRQ